MSHGIGTAQDCSYRMGRKNRNATSLAMDSISTTSERRAKMKKLAIITALLAAFPALSASADYKIRAKLMGFQ